MATKQQEAASSSLAKTREKRLRTPGEEKFRREYLGRGFVTFMGLLIIVITIAILLFLLVRGTASFTHFKHGVMDFLFSENWNPTDSFDSPGKGSIGAAVFIFGSILTCGLAILLATPFSLGAAIFMTEIAPKSGKTIFQPAVEIFVGIPSIVYGWVGLTVLVPWIRDTFQAPVGGYSVLAAVIVLTVMIFPTITTYITDTIRSVPDSYRQAAYGMGSTRWQVIKNIVIPASSTGIYTGIILGLARAFGEALAVSMVIGRTRLFPNGILFPTANITGILASDMGNTIDGSEANMGLWSLALLLMLISILFIVLIHVFSNIQKNKLEQEMSAMKAAEKADADLDEEVA